MHTLHVLHNRPFYLRKPERAGAMFNPGFLGKLTSIECIFVRRKTPPVACDGETIEPVKLRICLMFGRYCQTLLSFARGGIFGRGRSRHGSRVIS